MPETGRTENRLSCSPESRMPAGACVPVRQAAAALALLSALLLAGCGSVSGLTRESAAAPMRIADYTRIEVQDFRASAQASEDPAKAADNAKGLAAAQLAFVVIAGGVFLTLSRPNYQTLGSAVQPAAGNVIVIFRADATQKDILDALRASGASLVGGPTAADAYLLRVPAERRPAALASLQADDDVQLAQPIDEARP